MRAGYMTQGLLFPSARRVRRAHVQSGGEALAIHEREHAADLRFARNLAESLCRRNGTATISDVRGAMPQLDQARGSLTWLGATFNDARFVWTGEWVMSGDERRNTHAKPIKRWRLA